MADQPGTLQQAILQELSAAVMLSGSDLAKRLHCSRTAVWKQIEQLRAWGVPITASAGSGYALTAPIELLNGEQISALLNTKHQAAINDIQVQLVTGSTNDDVRQASEPVGQVVFAEHQTAGRGRRGRQWESPFAANLYLSLGWQFESGLAGLGCLSLAVALGVANGLAQCGVDGLGVKWPNDILRNRKKLAGCLVEIEGDAAGPCLCVIGVGVNYRMPESIQVDQPWADLTDLAGEFGRNQLAANVLDHLIASLLRFQQQGFAAMKTEWDTLDALRGHRVEVSGLNRSFSGIARGISDQGGLWVDCDGEIRECVAGEVSVRNG